MYATAKTDDDRKKAGEYMKYAELIKTVLIAYQYKEFANH
jgi:hypothetical protein